MNNNNTDSRKIMNEIQRLKSEVRNYSWLFGYDLSREIITSLEEKENEYVEQVMWLT